MSRHHEGPEDITSKTIVYPFSLRSGRMGPGRPLSEYLDKDSIGCMDKLFSEMEQSIGEPVRTFIAPSRQGGGPKVDMSDPETQKVRANLYEGLKQIAEERTGSLALQQTLEQ